MFKPNLELSDNIKPRATDDNGQYELEFPSEPEKVDRRSDKPPVSPQQERGQRVAAAEQKSDQEFDPFDWVGREKNRRERLAAELAEEQKKKEAAQDSVREQETLDREREENQQDIINTYRRF